jgi:hypothetical protein
VRATSLRKPLELAVAMAGMAGVDHLPGGRLQGGKQGRGAVPDLVVGTSLNSAWRHRPDRLGAHRLGPASSRPVGQAASQSFPHIALAPGDHRRASDPKPLGDLAVGDALGGQRQDPGPLGQHRRA